MLTYSILSDVSWMLMLTYSILYCVSAWLQLGCRRLNNNYLWITLNKKYTGGHRQTYGVCETMHIWSLIMLWNALEYKSKRKKKNAKVCIFEYLHEVVDGGVGGEGGGATGGEESSSEFGVEAQGHLQQLGVHPPRGAPWSQTHHLEHTAGFSTTHLEHTKGFSTHTTHLEHRRFEHAHNTPGTHQRF